MKKIILSVLVLSLAVAVQAQDGKGRRHHKMRGAHGQVMQKLDLSDDQKAKFKAENEAFRKQIADLKKDENITMKDFRSKMEAIRKERKAKMESLLTTEQKGQIEKMKAEHKAKREAFMKKRGEKMSQNLGLTDDQQAKLKANREKFQSQMKAIRENKSLDEAAKKEQMKELMKSQKEAMKSILTEEQIQKMKDSRKSREGGRKMHDRTKKETI